MLPLLCGVLRTCEIFIRKRALRNFAPDVNSSSQEIQVHESGNPLVQGPGFVFDLGHLEQRVQQSRLEVAITFLGVLRFCQETKYKFPGLTYPDFHSRLEMTRKRNQKYGAESC